LEEVTGLWVISGAGSGKPKGNRRGRKNGRGSTTSLLEIFKSWEQRGSRRGDAQCTNNLIAQRRLREKCDAKGGARAA